MERGFGEGGGIRICCGLIGEDGWIVWCVKCVLMDWRW